MHFSWSSGCLLAAFLLLNLLLSVRARVAVKECPSFAPSKNRFIRSSWPSLCERTCSFGIAVYGIRTGTSTRPYYVCCKGTTLKVLSSAFRIYSCVEETEVAVASTVPTVAPGSASTAAPQGASTAAPQDASTAAPQGASTAAPQGASTAAPQGASTAAPLGASTAAPLGASTAAPRGASTTAPPASPASPACVTPGVIEGCPKTSFKSSRRFHKQDNVCTYCCTFGIAVYGTSAGTQTNEVYSCCEGAELKSVSIPLRLYECVRN